MLHKIVIMKEIIAIILIALITTYIFNINVFNYFNLDLIHYKTIINVYYNSPKYSLILISILIILKIITSFYKWLIFSNRIAVNIKVDRIPGISMNILI